MKPAEVVSYTPWLHGVKHYEGLQTMPTQDVNGSYTIGYGHTIQKDEESFYANGISDLQAHRLLIKDMTLIAGKVIDALPKTDTCPHWLRAFCDMAYNCGTGVLKDTLVAKAFLNQDYETVPEYILEWDHATVDGKKVILPGLAARRKWDAQVYLYGTYAVI